MIHSVEMKMRKYFLSWNGYKLKMPPNGENENELKLINWRLKEITKSYGMKFVSYRLVIHKIKTHFILFEH